MQERAIDLAEAIRAAGPSGITEARLAWNFKLAFSSLRCNYRSYLVQIFPDISFVDGTYRSDPQTEADQVVSSLRSASSKEGP